MNSEYYPSDEDDFQDAYIESFRSSLAPSYRQYLTTEQIGSAIESMLESLPPMEREAFEALSMRNAAEFDLGGIIQTVAPLLGGAIGGPAGAAVGSLAGNVVAGQLVPQRRAGTRTVSQTRTTAATPAQRRASSEPSISQLVAAIVNNPQFLQALRQALSPVATNTAPAEPAPMPSAATTVTAISPTANATASAPLEAFFEQENYLGESTTYIDPRYWYWDPKTKQYRRRLAAPPTSAPDTRYWYYDTRYKQWRRRPTPSLASNSRDPRYWYYDSRSKQWRRRPVPLAPNYGNVPKPPAANPGTGQGGTQPAFPQEPTSNDPDYGTGPTNFPQMPEDPSTASAEPTTNSAANQLVALLNNPQFSQALQGQVMGDIGSGTATLQTDNGLTDIPFGALMNTLVELGQQAAEESVRMGSEESDKYLKDKGGNYRLDDPSNPEERAAHVMNLFREDFECKSRKADEAAMEEETFTETYDPLTDWLISAGMVQ